MLSKRPANAMLPPSLGDRPIQGSFSATESKGEKVCVQNFYVSEPCLDSYTRKAVRASFADNKESRGGYAALGDISRLRTSSSTRIERQTAKTYASSAGPTGTVRKANCSAGRYTTASCRARASATAMMR